MKSSDDFYVGWQSRAPARIASTVRRTLLLLVPGITILALAFAYAQQTIGTSVFEWGKVKEFAGVWKNSPYPYLLVPRAGSESFSAYYLVRPFKFGIDRQLAEELDGKAVRLKGPLIYRGSQTMIEVADKSIRESDPGQIPHPSAPAPVSLGEQTLVGEIVDSKCYLGVMNPGRLAPHRACAIRCISGGIPPLFLVRQKDGSALHLLLVASDGRPVNKEVLDLVALPVEITGEVFRQGELLVLRADPAAYRRL